MRKTYVYDDGIIYVTAPESSDREALRKATEDFLKKVINGGNQNGNNYSTTNFRKE